MPNGDPHQVDFLRQQFADLRGQYIALQEQLTRDTNSLAAQIRSLTSSINDNNTDVMTRLTAIESWQGAHEQLDKAAYTAVEVQNKQRTVEIEELAVQMGQSLGRFEDVQKKFAADLGALEKMYEQAAGAGKAWKWLVGVAGLALAVLNIIRLIGGH